MPISKQQKIKRKQIIGQHLQSRSRRGFLKTIVLSAFIGGAAYAGVSLVSRDTEKQRNKLASTQKDDLHIEGFQLTYVKSYEDMQGAVTSLAWRPMLQEIALASSDHSACIWNPFTSAQPRFYHGHQAAITALTWSPEGSRIASVARDGSVHIWSATTGERLNAITLPSPANALSWAAHEANTSIAVGCMDGRIYVLSSDDLHTKYICQGHTKAVTTVAWSNQDDPLLLASGSADYTARVWQGNQTQVTYTGHGNELASIAWSDYDLYVASAGADRNTHIWKVDKAQDRFTLHRGNNDLEGKDDPLQHKQPTAINALAWRPGEADFLATASADGSIDIWNVYGERLSASALRGSEPMHTISWSLDGGYIAIGGAPHHAHIYQLRPNYE